MNWVADRASSVGESSAESIFLEDSSRDEGYFVRNASIKTLRRIKTVKSPLSDFLFFDLSWFRPKNDLVMLIYSSAPRCSFNLIGHLHDEQRPFADED
jgi:hypothetical protein